MNQTHNVSVRLSEDDYNKLLFLHEYYNRHSYSKVSLADVLRIAIKENHITILKELQQQQQEKESNSIKELHQQETKETGETKELQQENDRS